MERDDLGARHEGVLGIAPVEGATHAAHHRRDLPAGFQVEPGAASTMPTASMPSTRGEGGTFRQAKARVQLGAVQAERLDRDPHPARPRLRYGQVRYPQVLYRPGTTEHHCFHCSVYIELHYQHLSLVARTARQWPGITKENITVRIASAMTILYCDLCSLSTNSG